MSKAKNKKEQSAIDVIMNWKYNPSKIEAEVDKKPFTKKEKELIENVSFSLKRKYIKEKDRR